MKNIYEQIIEHLINDDEAAARQLFHKEIVKQSRDIYNQLVAEEKEEEEDESEEEEDMEESIMNMDQTDSMMGGIRADQEGMDHEGDMDMGHDDDMGMGDDEDGMGHEEEHGDIEDRVMDLEDALDDLKAEFERLMSDEEGEADHNDGMDDPDFGKDDDDVEDESIMREYVEKVAKPGNTEGQGVGAGTIGGSTNSKSIVAGKNDMGGTAKNIAQGGANENPDDKQYKKPSNQYTKGEGSLKGAGSYENVPGANAGKAFSNAKKPVSKDGAANTKSPLAK